MQVQHYVPRHHGEVRFAMDLLSDYAQDGDEPWGAIDRMIAAAEVKLGAPWGSWRLREKEIFRLSELRRAIVILQGSW